VINLNDIFIRIQNKYSEKISELMKCCVIVRYNHIFQIKKNPVHIVLF